MPSLVLVKCPPYHPPPLEEIPISTEPQVIGRSPSDCQILLRHESVSKQHARILIDEGVAFIEDLKSRNHTYLNGTKLPSHCPKLLKPDDEIQICDFWFYYHAEDSYDRDVITQDSLVAPADRLNALMALSSAPPGLPNLEPLLNQVANTLFSTNLSQTLQLTPLLSQIADTLLGVFKNAEHCFLLLNDDSGRPQPKVIRCRQGEVGDIRAPRTIVKNTIDSMRCRLVVDATGSAVREPRSVMCVPLATSDGRAFGAIAIETSGNTEQFTAADLNLLTIVANLASVSIERVQLHAKAQKQAVDQSQMELAKKVQLGFLPQEDTTIDGYEFYSHYNPAETVGGDFYDFVPMPGGRVGIVLGDVAGHGVPAALLVAKLSSEVRFCLLSEPDPAKAVSLLNEQMYKPLRDRFVTMLVMVLDPASHQLTVVNAGHASPKLYTPTCRTLSDLISIETTGLLLGVEKGYKYQAVTVTLDPETTITAYTDGVTDAMNSAGKTFGTHTLEKYLVPPAADGIDAARPKRVGQAVIGAIEKHAKGWPQSDDIALVCFGRWEPTSESNSTLNGQASASGSQPE